MFLFYSLFYYFLLFDVVSQSGTRLNAWFNVIAGEKTSYTCNENKRFY